MSDDQTIVVAGSRGQLAFHAVFALALAAFFAWAEWAVLTGVFAPHNGSHSRYAWLAPFAPAIFPVMSGAMLWLSAVCAWRVRRPPHLELGPDGFTRVVSGRRRTWGWETIDSLGFDPYRGRVIFNGDRSKDTGGRLGPFPMPLEVSSRELFNLLAEGKRRWGSQPLADKPLSA